MFRQLVELFKRQPYVYAEVYSDNMRTSMNFTFRARPRTQMEVIGAPNSPPYILFERRGVYLDPSRRSRVTKDRKYYNILRIWDPRLIVGSLIDSSEKEEGGGVWTAEYDFNNLHIALPPEVMEIVRSENRNRDYRRPVRFENFNGMLNRMWQQDIDHGSVTMLAFKYPKNTARLL